jgi:acyl phosphate:glycerol-3-phosphate acyltransferase
VQRLLLIGVASYLLGSIPFGYLLVRVFHGEDVRQSGSGNIGATNVSRKSPVLGALTLILDALKGTGAVLLAAFLARPSSPCRAEAMAAFVAVLGHMFPIWLQFRGGKGVATGLGSFLVVAPKPVLISVVIFAVVVAATRFISLGSILAVLSFPVLSWLLPKCGHDAVALFFMTATSLFIVAKHHQNIRRLLAGTENRFGAKHA